MVQTCTPASMKMATGSSQIVIVLSLVVEVSNVSIALTTSLSLIGGTPLIYSLLHLKVVHFYFSSPERICRLLGWKN